MYSPPSSPSVLASTSRHNIIQPQHQQHQQKSLRLFLGHQSDEEAASDCDYSYGHGEEDDSDDDSLAGTASRSTQRHSLQPGRLPANSPGRPNGRTNSTRAYDDEDEEGHAELFLPRKRQRATASPKKYSIFTKQPTKQTAASSAAIPTTPTKRQKGFLVRGNVTPSRAFSIFKAAKQRTQQRQQHGLMTPPTSSPLRPIILDSFDDLDGDIDASPSRHRTARISLQSPSSASSHRASTLLDSSPKRLAFTTGPTGSVTMHTSHPHSPRGPTASLPSPRQCMACAHVNPSMATAAFLQRLAPSLPLASPPLTPIPIWTLSSPHLLAISKSHAAPTKRSSHTPSAQRTAILRAPSTLPPNGLPSVTMKDASLCSTLCLGRIASHRNNPLRTRSGKLLRLLPSLKCVAIR